VKGSIHHIDLTVRSFARSIPFYDAVMPLLGFPRSHDVPEGPIWAGSGIELGLVEARREAPIHDRFTPGLHHLAFRAPDRGSVDRVHEQLLELGVVVLDAPADYPQYGPGFYAFFFADPDGLKLEYAFTP
jgi:glyoxylase I family protein